VDSAGHEVIARTFRCGLRENGGFDFQKSQFIEVAACGLHQAVAEDEVPLELGTPEIECPVPEPQLLRGQLFLFFPRNGYGRSLRRTYDFQVGDMNLHLA
jgi:hypothetical protein